MDIGDLRFFLKHDKKNQGSTSINKDEVICFAEKAATSNTSNHNLEVSIRKTPKALVFTTNPDDPASSKKLQTKVKDIDNPISLFVSGKVAAVAFPYAASHTVLLSLKIEGGEDASTIQEKIFLLGTSFAKLADAAGVVYEEHIFPNEYGILADDEALIETTVKEEEPFEDDLEGMFDDDPREEVFPDAPSTVHPRPQLSIPMITGNTDDDATSAPEETEAVSAPAVAELEFDPEEELPEDDATAYDRDTVINSQAVEEELSAAMESANMMLEELSSFADPVSSSCEGQASPIDSITPSTGEPMGEQTQTPEAALPPTIPIPSHLANMLEEKAAEMEAREKEAEKSRNENRAANDENPAEKEDEVALLDERFEERKRKLTEAISRFSQSHTPVDNSATPALSGSPSTPNTTDDETTCSPDSSSAARQREAAAEKMMELEQLYMAEHAEKEGLLEQLPRLREQVAEKDLRIAELERSERFAKEAYNEAVGFVAKTQDDIDRLVKEMKDRLTEQMEASTSLRAALAASQEEKEGLERAATVAAKAAEGFSLDAERLENELAKEKIEKELLEADIQAAEAELVSLRSRVEELEDQLVEEAEKLEARLEEQREVAAAEMEKVCADHGDELRQVRNEAASLAAQAAEEADARVKEAEEKVEKAKQLAEERMDEMEKSIDAFTAEMIEKVQAGESGKADVEKELANAREELADMGADFEAAKTQIYKTSLKLGQAAKEKAEADAVLDELARKAEALEASNAQILEELSLANRQKNVLEMEVTRLTRNNRRCGSLFSKIMEKKGGKWRRKDVEKLQEDVSTLVAAIGIDACGGEAAEAAEAVESMESAEAQAVEEATACEAADDDEMRIDSLPVFDEGEVVEEVAAEEGDLASDELDAELSAEINAELEELGEVDFDQDDFDDCFGSVEIEGADDECYAIDLRDDDDDDDYAGEDAYDEGETIGVFEALGLEFEPTSEQNELAEEEVYGPGAAKTGEEEGEAKAFDGYGVMSQAELFSSVPTEDELEETEKADNKGGKKKVVTIAAAVGGATLVGGALYAVFTLSVSGVLG